MAWDYLKTYYPDGMVPTDNYGWISIDDLNNNDDIEVITHSESELSRKMKIRDITFIWGKNGEHATTNSYNIYGDTLHPDIDQCPLNVYGMAMINDYLYFHDPDD